MPPTLTCEPRPKITPLGLSKKTCPLDDSLPSISEGSEPSTRFNATDWALGCTKLTCASAPMLKVFQLVTRLALCWVTVMLALDCLMLPAPAAILPPVGKALSAGCRPAVVGGGAAAWSDATVSRPSSPRAATVNSGVAPCLRVTWCCARTFNVVDSVLSTSALRESLTTATRCASSLQTCLQSSVPGMQSADCAEIALKICTSSHALRRGRIRGNGRRGGDPGR